MTAESHCLVWQSDFIHTIEYTSVLYDTAIAVEGCIQGEGFGKLFQIIYGLQLDAQWLIQSFHITYRSETSFALSMHKNAQHAWLDEHGAAMTQLNSCQDIDISLTPFTNSLPINRLKLLPGASREITALFIDLPAPRCRPVRQRYTRLKERLYQYENLDSGFNTSFEVDENGFVLDYPGFWQRILPSKSPKHP